jgi:hypothetical protein
MRAPPFRRPATSGGSIERAASCCFLLVDPLALRHLHFDGDLALVPGPQGRLVFRLRSAALPVLIRTGSASTASVLRIPLVGAGGLTIRLDGVPPRGAHVFDAARGVEIGVVGEKP